MNGPISNAKTEVIASGRCVIHAVYRNNYAPDVQVFSLCAATSMPRFPTVRIEGGNPDLGRKASAFGIDVKNNLLVVFHERLDRRKMWGPIFIRADIYTRRGSIPGTPSTTSLPCPGQRPLGSRDGRRSGAASGSTPGSGRSRSCPATGPLARLRSTDVEFLGSEPVCGGSYRTKAALAPTSETQSIATKRKDLI